MKIRIVFLSAVLFCGAAHATNVRDALISAYQKNQELLEARQKVIAAHEKVVQAKSGFRPTVQAKARKTISKSRDKTQAGVASLNSLDKNRTGSVTLSQNIFRGFTDTAKVSQSEHNIQSLWAQLKNTEQDIFTKVIKAYLELYAKYASVEVYKANLAFTHKQFEAASAKRNIGEETRTQESLAEAKYIEAQSRLQSGLADLEAAKATFEQLTGLVAPERVDHPKELLEAPSSMETLQEIALSEHPKIKQAVEDIASAKQGKRSVTGALMPSLDLQATTSKAMAKNKKTFQDIDVTRTPSDTTYNNQVFLELTVPLYDAGFTRSQRREAGQNVVMTRITFEKIRQEIIQACKQVFRNYMAAKTNMDNSNRQVKAQEIAVEGTTQEMQVGTKILLDVLNAQAQLMQAKLDQINTIQNYYFYSYQILSLQGKLTAEGLQLPVEIFRPEQNYEEIKNHI